MSMLADRVRGKDGVLLAGDLLCFVVFAVLGLRSHEDGVTLAGVLRVAVPFQAGWLFVHFVLGKPGASTDTRQVARNWVPAWAIGLVLRTLLFDRSFEASFAVVALLVNGVLLMLWRGFWGLFIARPSR